MEIEPKVAAELAESIYDVQDEFLFKAFINKHAIFSKKTGDTQHLKAKVGSRIKKVKDGFGICALGGGIYENDIFLMPTGSVMHVLVLNFQKQGCRCISGLTKFLAACYPPFKNF
jgi:triacylglycerol lipase